MNIRRAVFAALILSQPALAADPALTEPHPVERPHGDLPTLLSDAPADALAVVYSHRPADLLTHPLVSGLLADPDAPPVAEAVRVLAGLFDGPLAVVVTGSPLRPDLLAVTLTAEVTHQPDSFFSMLEADLISALNRTTGLPFAGAIGFERRGDVATVRVPQPIPLALTFAFRDGTVRASSDRSVIDAWLSPSDGPAGGEPAGGKDAAALPETFVASDDFKRLVPEKAALPDLLLYLNCRTLMPLAKLAMGGEPQLWDILGLEQVEAVGLTASGSDRRWDTELTVCLADSSAVQPAGGPDGLIRTPDAKSGAPFRTGDPAPHSAWGVLNRSAGPPTLSRTGLLGLWPPSGRPVEVLGAFPDDTLLVLGGTFVSAAQFVDWLNETLHGVDPEIVEEYEQERAEFTREFGFDLHADFLGNLVHEWAVGVRAGAGGLPEIMAALRLDDEAVFDQQLRALAGAFDLKFTVTSYRGVNVYAPVSRRFHAAYGVADHYLLIGPDAARVCQMVDTVRDRGPRDDAPAARQSLDPTRQGQAGTPDVRRAARAMGRNACAFGRLDVSRLMRLAIQEEEARSGSESSLDESWGDLSGEQQAKRLERLAAAGLYANVAVSPNPGSVKVSVAFEGGRQDRAAAGETVARMAAASLTRARELSKRTVSAANLRGIVAAAQTYRGQHKGQWPESLSSLVQDGYVSLDMLGNVYDGTAPRTTADADRESYYLFRTDLPPGADGSTVVAGEREVRLGEGANFAFADGHVEFIPEPDATRLLATLDAP